MVEKLTEAGMPRVPGCRMAAEGEGEDQGSLRDIGVLPGSRVQVEGDSRYRWAGKVKTT